MTTTYLPQNKIEPTDELWIKLKDFSVESKNDLATIKFSFLERLAKENNWSIVYAIKVFDEYKKFLYLTIKSGHEVTPSDQVDQVWHLHLTYTHSYWDNLCKNILDCPLHHNPTKGGIVESTKYTNTYTETLKSYKTIFGHNPPANVWPETEKRMNNYKNLKRLNAIKYFILPKLPVFVILFALIIYFIFNIFSHNILLSDLIVYFLLILNIFLLLNKNYKVHV
jgi:hypothetical protein